MRIANESLIGVPPVAVSMAADFQLRALWLGHICNYSIQLVFTGSPTGTLSLQCSNDPGTPDGAAPANQATGVTNWTDIPSSDQSITDGGNHTWDVSNAGYTWVRAIYSSASGTGSLISARANVKGV